MHQGPEDVPQVVILTANPVEYQAVRRNLQEVREIVHERGTIYERGIFLTKDNVCEVGITRISMGNVQSATEAERAMTFFAPRFAFFVGVAGGIKNVRPGDVVVATKVYAYESGKEALRFQPRPEVGLPAYALLQRAQMEAIRSNWLQRCGETMPYPQPQVVVAPIAAGEKVQASTRSATYKLIKEMYGDTVAVEMEGYGFLFALHAHPQVGGLVIRGIADLIDEKSEADAAHFQERAACHASAFAFEVIARLIGQPDSGFSRSAFPKTVQEMPPLWPRAGNDNHFHFEQHGSNMGVMQQGDSNHNVQNFITQVLPEDRVTEGKAYMQRGQKALLRKDYINARQQLTEAAKLLHEDNAPAEKAQACYLQALAELGEKSPFGLTLTRMHQVEQIMERAIAFHPTYTYLFAAALFQRDFARNRWQESQYLHNAQKFMLHALEIQRLPEDKENLALLTNCQPHLVKDAQEW